MPIAAKSESTQSAKARPFLKWAGGKSSLLGHLTEFVPDKYNRYCEVFLGGGAFFFDIDPDEAILADANAELIHCYQIVQQKPDDLIQALNGYRNEKSEFYRIREQNPKTLSPVNRAARFIYLNKTCFNGLYRVNRAGKFNTPFANNPTKRFVDEENLFLASVALKKAKLLCCDFAEIAEIFAKTNDFIYFDPPYLPVSEYSDFKRYTPNQFGEADHTRLAETFRKLDKLGCYLLLSNSFHPKIKELYRGFRQEIVPAPRFINCKGGRRGNVNEFLIRNF